MKPTPSVPPTPPTQGRCPCGAAKAYRRVKGKRVQAKACNRCLADYLSGGGPTVYVPRYDLRTPLECTLEWERQAVAAASRAGRRNPFIDSE